MTIRAIPRLREVLGDEGVDELTTLVEDRVREQAVPRDEHHQVITGLDVVERGVGELKTELREFRREVDERFQRIDERFIEMDRHFEVRFEEMNRHFENRFDQVEQLLESRLDKMDQRLDEMHRRFDQMYDRMLVQTRWLIGSIALLGTVISILLAIGQFVQ